MGSRDPYLKSGQEQSGETMVTTLVNAAYYFLESVLVVLEGDNYRLIVCHHEQVLADEAYDTLRGAKIAFSKLFQPRVSIEVKPEWSPLYPPEKQWLQGKLKVCSLPFAAPNTIVTVPYTARTA